MAANFWDIKIPSIVAAELLYGASKSAKREYNLTRFRLFLEQFEIVHFDYAAAECYGKIRPGLELDDWTNPP
jgi:tRNA(fMet)-specific endonuclease VapC